MKERLGEQRLIYIAGAGRNGSTLLGNCLAMVPAIVFPGELTHVWKRGLIDNELCGCGEKFLECGFWNRVFQDDTDHLWDDKSAVYKLRNSASRFSRIGSFYAGRKPKESTDIAYVEHYRRLIQQLGSLGLGSVIVDSSKYPTDLAVLLECKHLLPPIHILHLVRDCRAVVYAWKKRKVRSEIHWQEQYMPRYGTLQTVVAWRLFNQLTSMLAGRYGVPYSLVRYEDLAREPVQVLSSIVNDIDLPNVTIASRFGSQQDTAFRSHPIGGNPSKFQFDFSSIRLEEEWVSRIRSLDRFWVDRIAGGLQRAYGYT